MDCKILNLNTVNGSGYSLTPIELKDVVPFEVKRVYYMEFTAGDSKTSQHCHKIEEEVFFQVSGASTIVIDRGQGKEEIKLVGPNTAIYIPAYVWHGFKDLSQGAVIMALSSTNYSADRSDYIENYDEYLKVRDEKL